MNPTLELVLRIIGVLIAAAGIAVVWLAPRIAEKRGLIDRKKIDPKLVEHMQPEEQEKYRREAAILDVKLYGLLIGTPGFVLILIAFS